MARLAGIPWTDYYQTYHRLYGHGLPAALVFAVVVFALARHRWRAALAAFASVHLHFLFDLAGSRGGDPEDLWPVHYLAPVSDAVTIVWEGQWELVSWQNTTLTAALVVIALAMAHRRGYSPVMLFSRKADAAVVRALRNRWRTG